MLLDEEINEITKAIQKLEKDGLLRTELQLGVVSSVSAHLLRVNLGCAGNPSAAYFSGGRYGKGEVGEFILVESQQGLLFGRIVEVRLPETDRKIISQDYSGINQLDAIAMVQLLGSVPMEDISISVGVDNYPRLGDRVYSAPHQFIALIPTLMGSKDKTSSMTVRLKLGNVVGASEGEVSVTPETLFGRHCAILGATGGGKSWTTARIIEECVKYNAKIILLDATGEYRGFSDGYTTHCHLSNSVDKAKNSIACSLPPSSFCESDFVALFRPSQGIQAPKLRAAFMSLRVVNSKVDLSENGLFIKANKLYDEINAIFSDPEVGAVAHNHKSPFDVNHLVKQIEQECYHENANGYGPKRSEQNWGYCSTLVSRISSVISSNEFSFVFNSSDVSISQKIEEFINDDKKLLRICMSGVSQEYQTKEIIANVIGRELLESARTLKFRKRPVIVIVDEAHNFIGKHIGTDDFLSRLDAFELIAKEGRKYGLNICLSTQRPRDITEGVLSQMGTLIVHRLTNDRDREVVERACGEIDRSASAFLPNLKSGEAAIIGVDFPIPLTVQINKPSIEPCSNGSNFQEYWKKK